MISAEATRIVVELELEGARNWAQRQGVVLDWEPHNLHLRATLFQPETRRSYFLLGVFTDYRALPPVWTFTDSGWLTTGRPIDFPRAASTKFGSSMFITFNSVAIICAPFNRLAYTDHSGPHADWGGPANWLNAGASHIHAETIGDMLQAIHRDFSVTGESMVNV